MAVQAWARGVSAMALMAAAQLASAAPQVITAAQLALVPADSAQAQFDTAAGWLRISEQISATMAGSDLFGYEGLWLGSAGNAGHYTLRSQQALAWLSLDLIALTALADEGTETLSNFSADAPFSVQADSPDGSVALVAGVLAPTEEDGRATLTFSGLDASGFAIASFRHDQPVPLQGFVVQRIRFEAVSAVPEPASTALWLLGAAALAGLRWRVHGSAPTAPGARGMDGLFVSDRSGQA